MKLDAALLRRLPRRGAEAGAESILTFAPRLQNPQSLGHPPRLGVACRLGRAGVAQMARVLHPAMVMAPLNDNVTECRDGGNQNNYKVARGMAMRAADLKLRCYAERDPDGSWFAICIDLNLYARADSLRAAKRELHTIIGEYVREAFGEDREHFHALMFHRKAPLSFVLKYYAIYFACKVLPKVLPRKRGDNHHRHFPYDDNLPVVPC